MLVKLTNGDGEPVHINPDYVVKVSKAAFHTDILLSTGESVKVRESVDETLAALGQAR